MIIDYEELIKKYLDKMIKNIASKRDVNKFNKLHQWYANSKKGDIWKEKEVLDLKIIVI